MAVFIKREYDYAIRICAYLASFYGQNKYVPVTAIAKKLFLTVPFTTKIIHQLKKQNLLATTQGKYGGIRLKQAPDKLSIFDVLNAMGFDMTVNECLRTPGICPLVKHCKIHLFFIDQERMLIDNLKNARIQDFVISDDELASHK